MVVTAAHVEVLKKVAETSFHLQGLHASQVRLLCRLLRFYGKHDESCQILTGKPLSGDEMRKRYSDWWRLPRDSRVCTCQWWQTLEMINRHDPCPIQETKAP